MEWPAVRMNFYFEADFAAMFAPAIRRRRGKSFLFHLRLGGDAGSRSIRRVPHEAGLIAFQIIEHQLHGVSYIRQNRLLAQRRTPSGNFLNLRMSQF